MIRIRCCHFLITAILFAYSAPAISQTPSYRVGVLMLGKPDRPQLQGLRDGLRDAGYTEGKNLRLEVPLMRTPDELRIVANRFVAEKKDAILTLGNIETTIAQEMTSQIPVLFMPTSDPVRYGFVKSLARPGTNITGLTYYVDLRESGKQIEIFKEIVFSLRRAFLLIDARQEAPIDTTSAAVIRKVARRLGIELFEEPVESLNEAEQAISSLSKHTTDAVLITCSSLFANLERIVAVSRQKLIPVHGCSSAHVTQYGALFSYAPNMYQMGRRGAWYVDRILKGAKVQELPIETPRKFELAINLRTAKEIGVNVPPEVLPRADRVIK